MAVFYPGILLTLAGLAIGGWLLVGPRLVQGVTLDVHTLFYAGLAIVLGFQSVVFAIFTKVFAVSERLLPEDPRLDRLFYYITLETGLAAGMLLLVGGLAGSLYAVSAWGAQGYGSLDASQTFRLVIPSGTAIILGFQRYYRVFFLVF